MAYKGSTPQTRLVSLGFESSSDTRAPMRMRLQVQDANTLEIISLVILSEHQFAALLSGLNVRAEAEI